MIRPLLFLALFAGAFLQQSQDTPGTVEGTLKSATTGAPIAGASVSLESSDADRTVLRVATDAEGHFLFENVPPRLYRVNTPRPNDLRPEQGGGPKTITVGAGQKLNMTLVRVSPGVISGRILNISGGPLVGAFVEALPVLYYSGRAMLWSIQAKARTDDRGEYRISVSPGSYYLQVSELAAPASPLPTSLPGEVDLSKPPTFFPGIVDVTKAEMVSVTSGGDTSRINFSSAGSAAAYKISGSVKTPANTPSVQIAVFPVDRPAQIGLIRGRAQPGGEFEIRGVVPGVYDLVATATPLPPPGIPTAEALRALKPLAFGRVRVTVSSQNMEGVVIPLDPGIPVPGRVVFSGNAPPASARIYLSVATDELPMTLVPYMDNPLGADRSFTFPNLPPARYTIKFSGLPEDFYIADIREGGSSIVSQGLRVEKAPLGPIEVIIKSPGAIVEGIVRDADQKGVPYTSAVLIPQKESRWNLDLQKTVTADGEGRFTFRGVAPGTYKVFAWEEKLAPENGNHELPDSFISKFEEFGSPLSISEAGHVQDIDVRLILSNR